MSRIEQIQAIPVNNSSANALLANGINLLTNAFNPLQQAVKEAHEKAREDATGQLQQFVAQHDPNDPDFQAGLEELRKSFTFAAPNERVIADSVFNRRNQISDLALKGEQTEGLRLNNDLTRKFGVQEKEADIGLKNAQATNLRAEAAYTAGPRSDLTRSQAEGQTIDNKFKPEAHRAEIDYKKAGTALNTVKAQIEGFNLEHLQSWDQVLAQHGDLVSRIVQGDFTSEDASNLISVLPPQARSTFIEAIKQGNTVKFQALASSMTYLTELYKSGAIKAGSNGVIDFSFPSPYSSQPSTYDPNTGKPISSSQPFVIPESTGGESVPIKGNPFKHVNPSLAPNPRGSLYSRSRADKAAIGIAIWEKESAGGDPDISNKKDGQRWSEEKGKWVDKYVFGKRGLVKMTVRQVLQAQDRGDYYAVGRYQFIRDTLDGTVDQVSKTKDIPFNRENQDILATFGKDLLFNYSVRQVITGQDNTRGGYNAAVNYLATQWAALKDSKGKGKYNYNGVDKAIIGPEYVKTMLAHSAKAYAHYKKQGYGEYQAYLAATTGNSEYLNSTPPSWFKLNIKSNIPQIYNTQPSKVASDLVGSNPPPVAPTAPVNTNQGNNPPVALLPMNGENNPQYLAPNNQETPQPEQQPQFNYPPPRNSPVDVLRNIVDNQLRLAGKQSQQPEGNTVVGDIKNLVSQKELSYLYTEGYLDRLQELPPKQQRDVYTRIHKIMLDRGTYLESSMGRLDANRLSEGTIRTRLNHLEDTFGKGIDAKLAGTFGLPENFKMNDLTRQAVKEIINIANDAFKYQEEDFKGITYLSLKDIGDILKEVNKQGDDISYTYSVNDTEMLKEKYGSKFAFNTEVIRGIVMKKYEEKFPRLRGFEEDILNEVRYAINGIKGGK